MKITDLSIRRPMLVVVMVIIVLILGGVSLTRLNIDLYPDMELPMGAVTTSYPGAGPKEVEQQITDPLESVLGTVENLDTISSESGMGQSTVLVEFDWGTDMNFASLDMREKVDVVKGELPDGADTPVVYKADVNMMPIMEIAVSGENPIELKNTVEDVVRPRLERVSGVASAWFVGGQEREIRVSVEPAKLNGHGMSLEELRSALAGENRDISAGTIREGKEELLLRVSGEFNNLDQVRRVVVGNYQNSPVYLEDVARVVDRTAEVTQISRVDGNPGITLNINKQSGANTVEVAQGVRAELENLKNDLPGTNFQVVQDQSEFISQAIDNLVTSAVIGGLLAVFVILMFLRNFRSTMIIATSIPFGIIGAFVLMYFQDMTLNMITLGGLALGIGLIVDDSIVVLENIFRLGERGMDKIAAARQGADEVGSAVIATSLTVVAVFVPIVFVEGLAAQLFTPMALSIAFCAVASLVIAITFVPMVSSRILKTANGSGGETEEKPRRKRRLFEISEKWFVKLDNIYSGLLKRAMGRRKITIIVVTIVFVGSLALIPLVGVEFMPGMDQGYVNISVEMPKGTALEETNSVVGEIEEELGNMDGIASISSGVGTGGDMVSGGSSDQAQVTVKLVEQSRRDFTSMELSDRLRQKFNDIPGADIEVSSQEQGMGGSAAPVEVTVSGDDLKTLESIGNDVAAVVRDVPGTREVSSSMEEGRPEMNVYVDRDRAAAYGLNLSQISSTVRAGMDGVVATRYRVEGGEYNLRVQLDNTDNATTSDLKNLTVATPMGTHVPLGQVAELKREQGPSSIHRQDQSRTVTVSAQLAGRDLGSVIEDLRKGVDSLDIPSGYLVSYGGEQEQMADAFGSLGLALIMAIVLVYLVMVAQFNSLVHPFVIMFSVPVTLTGVVLGLLVTGRTFSVPAFIGIIMLVGIVVKNAIVLVDYINLLRSRGYERNQAIMEAAPLRLRPILMTALTTIMAMLPMAIGLGEGAEGQTPMATAVVAGLAFSTLVTLVLVPVMYSIMDDFQEKLVNWRKRKRQKKLT